MMPLGVRWKRGSAGVMTSVSLSSLVSCPINNAGGSGGCFSSGWKVSEVVPAGCGVSVVDSGAGASSIRNVFLSNLSGATVVGLPGCCKELFLTSISVIGRKLSSLGGFGVATTGAVFCTVARWI